MIVKSDQAKKCNFKGIDFDVLATGESGMVTKMLYKEQQSVPFHVHPHEQYGYVISGKFEICIDNTIEILLPGDSYFIPPNERHRMIVLKPGEVLDFFSPPRDDYK